MNIQAHTDPASASPAAGEALVALVRLLARQAAREVMDAAVLSGSPDDDIPIDDPESES